MSLLRGLTHLREFCPVCGAEHGIEGLMARRIRHLAGLEGRMVRLRPIGLDDLAVCPTDPLCVVESEDDLTLVAVSREVEFRYAEDDFGIRYFNSKLQWKVAHAFLEVS